MATSSLIGRLAVSLTLETAAFQEGATLAEKRFEQSRKRFEKIGSAMTNIGTKLSIGLTAPLAALGVASYKAAQESADALGQVNSALASMGDQAGRTSEQLQALAETQMGQSLYDDDEILRKVTANLLTFGNISGQAFDKAQQAALDLSARMGMDLQSSALLVGKALNDPVKGMSALSRAGIQFTADQKEAIKAMVEGGNAAGAQAMILKELEKQYGGAALAARKADPTAESKQAWAEFQETIGALVVKILPPLTDFLTRILDGFNNLSPGMQKVIVVGGALLAVLGPVLTVFGSLVTVGAPLLAFITTLAPALGLVGKALLLIALNPAVLAFAAVIGGIYLAWKNWDKIEPIIRNLYNGVKTWIVDKLGKVWDWVMDKIRAVGAMFEWLYTAVVGNSYVPDMVDGIAAEMARLDEAMVKPADKATGKTAQAFQKMATEIKGILDRLFPATAATRQYQAERAVLGNIADPAARERALRALANERGMASDNRWGLDVSGWAVPLDGALKGVGDRIEDLTARAKVGTVKIAKTFKDMADDTMSALSKLSSAIQSGGFLGILEGVIGLGLQLGSVGAFGKTIAGRINAVPALANGTNFHRGGPALVGEEGPELVDLPRGTRVTPNNALGGLTRVQVIPSPYFNVVVDERAAGVAVPLAGMASSAGSVGAQTAMARRSARRLP